MILRHSSKALLLAVYAYTVFFVATRASGKLTAVKCRAIVSFFCGSIAKRGGNLYFALATSS